MSRGIVIFGINNPRVDYVQLAIICSLFIRKNMPNTKVCLITDISSKAYQDGKGDKPLSELFDNVVLLPDQPQKFENIRRYRDTQYYGFDEQFKNETRSSAYYLSPYDETILIDSDYFICNDVLSKMWGSVEDIHINVKACDLFHQPLQGTEERLNPYGIPMYWATIIYFKKGDKAKKLFDLVDHIKDNWEFYKLSYEFPNALFRNDYAFSIAIHILNGMFEQTNYVVPTTDPVILSALDTDQFYGITDSKTLHFFMQDKKETWKYLGTKTEGLNVHCMNKLSIMNNMDAILEVLQ